ncbi:hypothetical protein E2C01_057430 [Portunus trituberculatus]|uniref:Uncharacterized protein n=1 Tax=Portunus trituberculatus TaxID=210409 RepID=A0A5B7GWS4_PORTR|nr:hypothetical protein [Portunus trituberculatus]
MAKVASEGFEAWREQGGGGRDGIPSLSLALRSSAVLYELNGKSFMVFWFSVLPPREARLAGRCLRPRLLVVAVTSVVTRRPPGYCSWTVEVIHNAFVSFVARHARTPSHPVTRHALPQLPIPSLTTPPSYTVPRHTPLTHTTHNHHRLLTSTHLPPTTPIITSGPPTHPRPPPTTQTINFLAQSKAKPSLVPRKHSKSSSVDITPRRPLLYTFYIPGGGLGGEMNGGVGREGKL